MKWMNQFHEKRGRKKQEMKERLALLDKITSG
jgi:hypothetical protein